MSIRTVQTSYSTSSSSLSASNFGNVLGNISLNSPRSTPVRYDPQDKFAQGLGRGGRRRSGSFTYYSGNNYNSGNVDLRRPGLSRLPYNSNKRSYTAPPPPSAQGSCSGEFPKPSPKKVDLDPIQSEHGPTSIASHHRTSSVPPRRPANTHNTKLMPPTLNAVPICVTPPPLPVLDKETGAKLVAGILLNRIHAVGKPMRRRLQQRGRGKEYAKSGLSRVICLEC